MTSNNIELHYTTECGHEAVVKPVRKVGGKWQGKWICQIRGPKITNPKGIQTTFAEPDSNSAKERIAIALGIPTCQVTLLTEEQQAVTTTMEENTSPLLTQADADILRNEENVPPSSSSRKTNSSFATKKKHKRSMPVAAKKRSEAQDDNQSPSSSSKKPRVKKRKEPDTIVTVRSTLKEALRSMRSKYAREKQLPPYFIFCNAALDEIVTKLPLNEAELLTIHGIGPHKAKEYGPLILEVIRREIQPMLVSQDGGAGSEGNTSSSDGEGCASRYFSQS